MRWVHCLFEGINEIRYSLFKRSEFFKNSAILVSGTTISQILPILLTPLLTRYYNPEDFGILALFMSIASILNILVGARYDQAIVLPKSDKDAMHIVVLSTILSLIIGLSLTLAVFLFKASIIRFLGEPKIASYLVLIPIFFIITAIYQISLQWNNRKKKYKAISSNNILKSTFQIGSKFSLYFVYQTEKGLIFATFLGQLFHSILMLKELIKYNFLFTFFSFKNLKTIAIRYNAFPGFNLLSALFNTISVHFVIILLSKFYDSEIVGFYSLANTLLRIPLTFIGISLGQVYFQKINEIKHNKHDVKKLTFNLYKKLLLIGVLPMSIVAFFGDFIFPFFLGVNWDLSGKYAQYMSLWLLFVFISSPLSFLLTALECLKEVFVFNLVTFIIRISVIVLTSGILKKDSLFTVALFSFASFACWFFYSVYILYKSGTNVKDILIFSAKIILPVFLVLFLLRLMILNL